MNEQQLRIQANAYTAWRKSNPRCDYYPHTLQPTWRHLTRREQQVMKRTLNGSTRLIAKAQVTLTDGR